MGSIPMPLCAPQVVAKPGILRDVIGDNGGGDLVHFKSAVGFGDFDRAQPEFAGLFQQFAGNGEILVLDLLGVRQDLVDGKLFRRLSDQLVLFAEIFRSEYCLRAVAASSRKLPPEILVFGNCVVVAIVYPCERNRRIRGGKNICHSNAAKEGNG